LFFTPQISISTCRIFPFSSGIFFPANFPHTNTYLLPIGVSSLLIKSPSSHLYLLQHFIFNRRNFLFTSSSFSALHLQPSDLYS
jgi:hypothetical protein